MTFNINEYAIPTIYSYYYPETKAMIDQLNGTYVHSDYEAVWLKNGLVGEASLPQYIEDFFNAYEFSSGLENKGSFYKKYVTNGSSEAIRESFAEYKAQWGDKARIHMFLGEYEGFYQYAKCFNIDVVFHCRDSYQDSLRIVKDHEIFIITNPSSIDGNEWDGFHHFVSFISQHHSGLELYVDLTYLGVALNSTNFIKDLMNSRVLSKIFFSMSKAFGMYYHRLGGVYSKVYMGSLEGNRWFHNKFSIRLGTELLDKYKLNTLANTLKPYQDKVVEILKKEFNDPTIKASDSVLIATGDKVIGFLDPRNKFNRVNIARYCLTPGINKLYLEDKGK